MPTETKAKPRRTTLARAGDTTIANLIIVVVVIAMFGAILLALRIGRAAGRRRAEHEPEAGSEGLSALDGAVYGLMGLLIAFTFSGAAGRFDARRDLITRETNAIGTAYLRISLLPAAQQPRLRQAFRDYTTERIAVFENVIDERATDGATARANALQNVIWREAVADTQAQPSPTVMSLLLSAINDMFDVTTERAVALATHPPPVIFALLAVAVLVSSLMAGYAMGVKRSESPIHVFGFALIMTTALFVIIDMEYPRIGIIRIDAADGILIQLRDSMHASPTATGATE